MIVHFGISAGFRPEWPEAFAVMGTFDGVHLGHRELISEAALAAHDSNLPCVLVTFDRHPSATLAPDRTPPALATLSENLRHFAELAVDGVVVLPFDEALSQMPAQQFVDDILLGPIRTSELWVGHDFALGRNREGTVDWLRSRLRTTVLSPVEIDGERVSSRAIRAAVQAGQVERAARSLGRNYALEGVVVRGQQLGRTLGFPTANLARSGTVVLPADGVYAGWFESPRGRYPAAIAIGTRPAVGGGDRSVEAYLLDYPGESLYGLASRLEFVSRIRPEQNFPDLNALVEQMKLDVIEARDRLGLISSS